jgi:hypothetical protein
MILSVILVLACLLIGTVDCAQEEFTKEYFEILNRNVDPTILDRLRLEKQQLVEPPQQQQQERQLQTQPQDISQQQLVPQQPQQQQQPMSPRNLVPTDETNWVPPPVPAKLRSVDRQNRKRELMELLFPPMLNRSRHMPHKYLTNKYERSLYGEFIPDSENNCPNSDKNNPGAKTNLTADSEVVCVGCSSLSVCSALNGLSVQEVYYPKNADLKGTCAIIEQLGKRMSREIFGVGRTFRDTPDCRSKYHMIMYMYFL